MSNIPRQQDVIPGYQHPDSVNSINSKKSSIYTTYTFEEGKKVKSNKTTTDKCYKKVQDFAIEEEEKFPECNQPPVHFCKCYYSDKACANGHKWYYERDGKVKIGDCHKK